MRCRLCVPPSFDHLLSEPSFRLGPVYPKMQNLRENLPCQEPALRIAGKRRRWKTSGTLINGPEITNMTSFIKTSASTGAISSIRQRKIPASPLTGWKKCRRPLKRSKKKPCKGNGRSRRKKPARKNLRTGSWSRRISFWIWRKQNVDGFKCEAHYRYKGADRRSNSALLNVRSPDDRITNCHTDNRNDIELTMWVCIVGRDQYTYI